MAIDTIRNDEIFIDGIEGYGFHRTQKLTKQILVNIISRYFSRHHKSYQLTLPSLSEFGNESGNSLLHILEEFPYQERKVPCIIVTSSDAKEYKRYIGTDNTVSTLKTGEKAYQQYAGASSMMTTLVVVAESPDVRMELASLLHVCFTHYHRWHYFFVGDDDSSFSIIPSIGTIRYGSQFQVDEGNNKVLYCMNVSFETEVDYVFLDSLEATTYRSINFNVEIDPLSGPQPSSIIGG